MKLKDTTLLREQLALSDEKVNVLGPGLVLDQCGVRSDCDSEAIVIAGLTMTGGTFDQRRVLSNFHFERAHLKGVTFLGTYVGCDFGDWEDAGASSISDCTFATARLDGCRFLNCKPQTIKFPRWPCFVILEPSTAAEYVASRQWPKGLKSTLSTYTDTEPSCVAVCGDAERIAAKDQLTLSELRDFLSTVPGIQIVD